MVMTLLRPGVLVVRARLVCLVRLFRKLPFSNTLLAIEVSKKAFTDAHEHSEAVCCLNISTDLNPVQQ